MATFEKEFVIVFFKTIVVSYILDKVVAVIAAKKLAFFKILAKTMIYLSIVGNIA